LIKFFDICLKISIMDKLYNKKNIGILTQILKENPSISIMLKSTGLLLYPSLFIFGYMIS
jgi:hypothetical protein